MIHGADLTCCSRRRSPLRPYQNVPRTWHLQAHSHTPLRHPHVPTLMSVISFPLGRIRSSHRGCEGLVLAERGSRPWLSVMGALSGGYSPAPCRSAGCSCLKVLWYVYLSRIIDLSTYVAQHWSQSICALLTRCAYT